MAGASLGYEYPPLEVVTRAAARGVEVAACAINGLLLGCNEFVYRIVRAFSRSPTAIAGEFRALCPGWFQYGGQAAPGKPNPSDMSPQA